MGTREQEDHPSNHERAQQKQHGNALVALLVCVIFPTRQNASLLSLGNVSNSPVKLCPQSSAPQQPCVQKTAHLCLDSARRLGSACTNGITAPICVYHTPICVCVHIYICAFSLIRPWSLRNNDHPCRSYEFFEEAFQAPFSPSN